MDSARDTLPDDIGALKAALIIERANALEVAADLAVTRARASQDMALIAHQKLRIARLERQLYGQRSEHSSRLIDQLALGFRVAKDLGESEDWLFDVASETDVEDGVIWVQGDAEDGVMAFTDFGIENLIDLIKIHKDDPTIIERWNARK